MISGYEANKGSIYYMGRNGHGPKWSWAEMVMGRNDPEFSPGVRGLNQNQNSLLVKRQNDNTSPGDWPRKISP